MEAKRQGEIALEYLKYQTWRDGLKLSQNSRREIGNIAKAIGISFEEAMEFAEIIARETVEKTFPKKQQTQVQKMTGRAKRSS